MSNGSSHPKYFQCSECKVLPNGAFHMVLSLMTPFSIAFYYYFPKSVLYMIIMPSKKLFPAARPQWLAGP